MPTTPVVERIYPRHVSLAKHPAAWVRRHAVPVGISSVALVGLVTYAFLSYARQVTRPLPLTASVVPQIGVATYPSPTSATGNAYSALNGRAVASGKENLAPLAVMIENHPASRPQAGLGAANLVYEALVEGGVTRFMAIFDDPKGTAAKVGPIRSARSYYLHIADELHADYAHAGGSADALDELAAGSPVFDLDGLSIGAPVFVRDYSRNVSQEHTLYATTAALSDYVRGRGWPSSGSFPSWKFQDEPSGGLPASGQKISVSVSSSEYAVTWTYDSATDSYLRTMGGTAHVDADTGKQITAKNVILQTVPKQPTVSRAGEAGLSMTLTGSGPAAIIQNGTVIQGSWKYDGIRTRYFDGSGNEVSLVRGTTWIELVHSDSTISY